VSSRQFVGLPNVQLVTKYLKKSAAPKKVATSRRHNRSASLEAGSGVTSLLVALPLPDPYSKSCAVDKPLFNGAVRRFVELADKYFPEKLPHKREGLYQLSRDNQNNSSDSRSDNVSQSSASPNENITGCKPATNLSLLAGQHEDGLPEGIHNLIQCEADVAMDLVNNAAKLHHDTKHKISVKGRSCDLIRATTCQGTQMGSVRNKKQAPLQSFDVQASSPTNLSCRSTGKYIP
jgi:hypothetical protein